MRTLLSLLALALLSAETPAQVAHYWVDAVNGSDTNPGTQALPFKTLTMGLTFWNTDMVVHVMPGTYGPQTTGDFWDSALGTSAQIRLQDYINVKIVGEDRATCIVDFTDPSGAPIGDIFYGMIRISGQITNGVEISNLTFKNLTDAPQWGCGPICVTGDPSNIDIHDCYFEDTSSTFICWGGYDVGFHDNVIVSSPANAQRFVAVRVRTQYFSVTNGDRTYIYNNTIYNTNHGISYDGSNPYNQFIFNNLVIGSNIGFPGSGPSSPLVMIENNLAYNCNTNFAYTPPASNLQVDPLLVNPAGGDFHQQAGSPCLDAGHPLPLPYMVNDHYGNARVVDGDDNGSALVDIGAHEVEDVTLSVSNWGPGQMASFQFQQQSTNTYLALLMFAADSGSLVLPGIGSIGLDLTAYLTSFTSPVPGNVSFTVPSIPFLAGWPIYAQGVAGGPAPSGTFVLKPTGTVTLYL